MKRGLILPALVCWSAGAMFAADTSIPASTGMPEAGLVALTADEQEAIAGGDLYLAVNRDTQMMTVTRIVPGDYTNAESYAVKVTTSVTRNSDVTSTVAKGAMENKNRDLNAGLGSAFPKQFPTTTAQLSSTPTTRANVTGPVIQTNATQTVTTTDGNKNATGQRIDSGYNIHYVDPAKAQNTWGCIGVQSAAGMAKVVNSLKTDSASYPAGAPKVQTVTVSAYTNGAVPAASTFQAKEVKPTPAPAASKAAASSSSTKAWWKFW